MIVVWTFDQDSLPSDDALEILLDGVASLGDLEGGAGDGRAVTSTPGETEYLLSSDALE